MEHAGKATETSERFRRWTAISAIAALLERRVWADLTSRLYPNLYVFLVGPAGVGKTRAIDTMMRILQQVPEFKFSPTSVTKASLVDCLSEAKRSLPGDWSAGGMEQYNALYIAVDELSSFMSKWDDQLVGALTKFFDGNAYSESRRTGNLFVTIEKPNVNVICGSTPSHLTTVMPDGVWDQGFASRVVMVWAQDKIHQDVMLKREVEDDISDLLHDASYIHKYISGPITCTDDYRREMDDWRRTGCKPYPTHPKLADYCSRRYSHVIKLSIVSAVDRGEMIMTLEDFRRARGWLEENETNIHNIFSTTTSVIDNKAFDEIEEFVRRKGQAVARHTLLHQLGRFIPSYGVERALLLMVAQKRLREIVGKGTVSYVLGDALKSGSDSHDPVQKPSDD